MMEKLKYNQEAKEFILFNWDGVTCIHCKKEEAIIDEYGKRLWYCEDCSKETLIEAIMEISVNSKSEIKSFVDNTK